MGLWGLKYPIIEAIAFHHYPAKCNLQMGILTAVHAGDALAHEVGVSATNDMPEMDASYLAELNMTERFPVWQSACQEFIQRGENLDG